MRGKNGWSSRRWAATGLVAVVLTLHGSGLRWLAPASAQPPRAAALMQVRQVAAAPVPPAPVTTQAAPEVAPVRAPRAAERRPAPAPVVPRAPMSGVASAPAAAPPQEPVAMPSPPPYATRFAPPFEARFRLQRGVLSGEATLQWAHDGQAYQLHLQARAMLLGTVFSQQSTGRMDEQGLAPQRFTERRWRRGERAVNFVHPADGTAPYVSFSARAGQVPWTPAMQDRLSWMMQLGAIVAARPAGPQVGETIELDVAGPAGEVQHWVFRVAEPATPGSGVKLLRTPSAAYDTDAQVWLDPTRHYQPLRIRLAEARGDALELTRLEPDGAP